MDGLDKTGAREQRPEDGEHEGAEDEPDVPGLHHAALLLHHDRVQEGGAGEPGHERGVFNGVPSPVAAPAEHAVCPVGAEKDAHGEEHPGDHRPAAGDVDPLFARVAHHQRTESEREGDGEPDIAEVEHRRMNHHLRVLKQGTEAEAVQGLRAGLDRERRRGEVQDGQKEDLNSGEDCGREGGEADIDAMADAQNESISREQERPEEQRPFLARPDCGELVRPPEGAVGVVQDVGDGVVAGVRGPDQGKSGAGGCDKAADARAAGRFAELTGDIGRCAREPFRTRRPPERESAYNQRVHAEHEREEQGEAAKLRHGMHLHDFAPTSFSQLERQWAMAGIERRRCACAR